MPAALLNHIRRLHLKLDQRMRRAFRRSLPMGELFTDRWQRARRLGFGDGSSIYDSSLVFGEVKVGAHTWIGPYTILDGSGGELEIGDNCSISAGVHIYSHDSVLRSLSGGRAPLRHAKTTIASNCYIGPHSVIEAGVSIGQGCLIGALSVVRQNLPPQVMAAGCPAEILYRVQVDENGVLQKTPYQRGAL